MMMRSSRKIAAGINQETNEKTWGKWNEMKKRPKFSKLQKIFFIFLGC